MLDLLTQFPIEDENLSMVELQQEAVAETRTMAMKIGYAFAGPPSFELLEMPLFMCLQCRVPVVELQFGGGSRGK